MKARIMLTATLLAVCALYSGSNWARSRFDFYFGVPLYPYHSYPYYPFQSSYYYPPYYYPPTIITVPVTPPTYIQQSPPQTTQQYPSGYWYYCNNPKGYYPYIKQCTESWQEVEPIPPTPR